MVFWWVQSAIVIIVVTARFLKNAGRRKEDFMRENVLRRMEQEVKCYREYLVSGRLAAGQIVEEAYQLAVKQGLYHAFANHNYSRLSAEEWNWLNQQEHIVDYLYSLWMGSDMDLTEEFAGIIRNELNLDREVHTNE